MFKSKLVWCQALTIAFICSKRIWIVIRWECLLPSFCTLHEWPLTKPLFYTGLQFTVSFDKGCIHYYISTIREVIFWIQNHIMKVQPHSWTTNMYIRKFRGFYRGTFSLCGSKGCKVKVRQSWRSEKYLLPWLIWGCSGFDSRWMRSSLKFDVLYLFILITKLQRKIVSLWKALNFLDSMFDTQEGGNNFMYEFWIQVALSAFTALMK